MLQDELLTSYKDIREGLDAAPESSVPFPVVKDEKLSVIGDANETQINKRDFTLHFELPKGTTDGEETETGVIKEIEYKDVFVSPRQRAKVVASFCKLLPFFRKIEESGGASEFTDEEYAELLSENGDEYIDGMYEVVAKTLGVDPALAEYIKFEDVIKTTARIFKEFPDIVNEAEAFF